MTTRVSTPRPIQIQPGVRPLTEGTALTTQQWIYANGIRFVNGFPQKRGGFQSITFNYSNMVTGSCRSIFSCDFLNTVVTLFGTHTRLFSLIGTQLTNITPQTSSTTAVNAGLATLYGTLANNPLTTVNGSNLVTVADTSAGRFQPGDFYTLSGATTVGGIAIGNLNITAIVASVAANGLSLVIQAAAAATSGATGGGNAVVRSCGIINVTSAAHGLPNGDRIGITLAATTAGITAAQINLQQIIRNVATNSFDIMTAGLATSATTGGGGASTVYTQQIPAGLQNAQGGQGYGMGLYGQGLYGTALSSGASYSQPQIWFWCQQQFSNVLIGTPGNQTGVYEWAGNIATAPVPTANAPTTINYVFISDDTVITFGNVNGNRIKTSNVFDRTNWTSSSSNTVFVEDLEGAGTLISHLNANNVNVIFTTTQCYTMTNIGGNAIWSIQPLNNEVGIIGPMARVVVNGVGYWMGQQNFYMWMGAAIMIIPANTQASCTLLKYIFQNMNRAQASKFYAVHKESFNEVEFHYCSATSEECDSVVRLNLYDFSWTMDTDDRTAYEYPVVNQVYPIAISSENTAYFEEKGTDADGQPLPWTLTSNDRVSGKDNATIVSFVPDSIQTGDIDVEVFGRLFPQSSKNMFDSTYTVSPTTERVPTTSSARLWRYTFSGETIGQQWIMGAWVEELQPGAGN